MPTDPKLWSSDQFKAFLLLHASYADYDYSDAERSAILARVDETTLTDVQIYYDSLSEYQRLDHLIQAKETHVSTPQAKDEVRKLLTDIFAADGETSRPERTLMAFLDRLL